jgi:chaperonin GroEL
MSKDYAQIANDVVTGVGLLRQSAPDTAKAFSSLSTAATVTKALDTKTKELMALAIGIAVHCEGCVAYHTKMAHHAQTGEFGNLVSKGIIDPTKVVRIALQDGASIAGLLITTEAMVAEKPKKETPMPAMPPGGGMDY